MLWASGFSVPQFPFLKDWDNNSPCLREVRTRWVNDCNMLPLAAAIGGLSRQQNALTPPPCSWPEKTWLTRLPEPLLCARHCPCPQSTQSRGSDAPSSRKPLLATTPVPSLGSRGAPPDPGLGWLGVSLISAVSDSPPVPQPGTQRGHRQGLASWGLSLEVEGPTVLEGVEV